VQPATNVPIDLAREISSQYESLTQMKFCFDLDAEARRSVVDGVADREGQPD
jgi:hypothetical protein